MKIKKPEFVRTPVLIFVSAYGNGFDNDKTVIILNRDGVCSGSGTSEGKAVGAVDLACGIVDAALCILDLAGCGVCTGSRTDNVNIVKVLNRYVESVNADLGSGFRFNGYLVSHIGSAVVISYENGVNAGLGYLVGEGAGSTELIGGSSVDTVGLELLVAVVNTLCELDVVCSLKIIDIYGKLICTYVCGNSGGFGFAASAAAGTGPGTVTVIVPIAPAVAESGNSVGVAVAAVASKGMFACFGAAFSLSL